MALHKFFFYGNFKKQNISNVRTVLPRKLLSLHYTVYRVVNVNKEGIADSHGVSEVLIRVGSLTLHLLA